VIEVRQMGGSIDDREPTSGYVALRLSKERAKPRDLSSTAAAN